jgi:hypothetical protein
MGKERIEKQSFIMYDCVFEEALNLNDADFKECILMIRDYALYGIEAESKSMGVNIVFTMAKPLLDAANKRHEQRMKQKNKRKTNQENE